MTDDPENPVDPIHLIPPIAVPRRQGQCNCLIPDPVMQADGRFYCYKCSLLTNARPPNYEGAT